MTVKSLAEKFVKIFGVNKSGEQIEIDPATLNPEPSVDQAVAALALAMKNANGDATKLTKIAEDFRAYVDGADPVAVSAALTKAQLQVTSEGVIKSTKQENNDMASEALKKSLGLKPEATDAEVDAAVTKLASDNALTAKRMASIVKMTPEVHAYFVTLDKAAQDATADMDADDQAAAAAAAAKKPAKKSAADEAIEKANKTAADALEEVAKLRDDRQLESVIKRVSPMTFIGKADDVGAIIHKIATGKANKDTAEQLETMLKALNSQLEKSSLFSERGNGMGGPVGKAFDAIDAAAKEMKKANPSWSIEKCRTKAREANVELAKQEQAEQAARDKAA